MARAKYAEEQNHVESSFDHEDMTMPQYAAILHLQTLERVRPDRGVPHVMAAKVTRFEMERLALRRLVGTARMAFIY